VAFIERAEGAHVAFGHGGKQHLVARAAVHVLTVASPGRKGFTPRPETFGPVPPARYAPANHGKHSLSVSLPEDATTGHADRRTALEFGTPHWPARTCTR
jgi:hypothetical protein